MPPIRKLLALQTTFFLRCCYLFMQNRQTYRIVVTVACFLFAGLNAYEIITGDYTVIDIFLLVMFLICGFTYTYLLLQKNKEN